MLLQSYRMAHYHGLSLLTAPMWYRYILASFTGSCAGELPVCTRLSCRGANSVYQALVQGS